MIGSLELFLKGNLIESQALEDWRLEHHYFDSELNVPVRATKGSLVRGVGLSEDRRVYWVKPTFYFGEDSTRGGYRYGHFHRIQLSLPAQVEGSMMVYDITRELAVFQNQNGKRYSIVEGTKLIDQSQIELTIFWEVGID